MKNSTNFETNFYNNIFTVLEQTRKITCKPVFNDNYKNFNLALFELVYNQKL